MSEPEIPVPPPLAKPATIDPVTVVVPLPPEATEKPPAIVAKPASHRHTWQERKSLSTRSCFVDCIECGKRAVAKGRGMTHAPYTTVVNEWICYHLMYLLQSHGLPDVLLLPVTFSHSPELRIRPGVNVDVGPWYHTAAIIEALVGYSRFAPQEVGVENYRWPTWLYHFDRWVGRLDGHADANLLVLPDKTVVPIDWEMVFPWSVGWDTTVARRVDAMEVPCEQHVKAAASEKARAAIKSITDAEIWQVCCSHEIPRELIEFGRLVSYWSGLCTRRDLL